MNPSLTLDTLSSHMIPIEGGTFEMGGETNYDDSLPVHKVKLDNFLMCRYPVTQILWEAVMGSNPSAFPHPQRPVERVTWYDCIEFCNELSKLQGLSPAYHIDRDQQDPNNENDDDELTWTVSIVPGADGYRLPTEAEWEYAARGGRYAQPHKYVGSPNHNEIAHWDLNSHDMSQPVGQKAPNALGLYDLSGNVYEWVWDWFGGTYYQQCQDQGTVANPLGPPKGEYRGVRGGSWDSSNEDGLRVAYRVNDDPNFRDVDNGCRLCRYLPV